MTSAHLQADLIADEGCRLAAYPDPLSPLGRQLALRPAARAADWRSRSGRPWTIGVGHAGPEVQAATVWSHARCLSALAQDVAAVERDLDAEAPWWRTLSDLRQDVLANMAFNLGVRGLLEFKAMLQACEAGEFARAAEAMLASTWARQLPGRAARLAEQMRSGRRAPGASGGEDP